jgi:hypothetical protein
MVNWNPDWDNNEDTDGSEPEAENKSVVEYLDELGRKNPSQRLFGSMKYPMAFQSFTMKHPAIGSAIIGIAFFAFLFVVGSAAAQGRDGLLVLTVSAFLAVLVFAGNWLGARYASTQGSRHKRTLDV